MSGPLNTRIVPLARLLPRGLCRLRSVRSTLFRGRFWLCRAELWRVPQKPCPPSPGNPPRDVPLRTPFALGIASGRGQHIQGHPPGPPWISLAQGARLPGVPCFRGRGNAFPLRAESSPARRPGVPGGVCRWGGAGRPAKADGETLHPRGEGEGHLGRPPGGRSNWCTLHIWVLAGGFVPFSFSSRPARAEVNAGESSRVTRCTPVAAPTSPEGFLAIRRTADGRSE